MSEVSRDTLKSLARLDRAYRAFPLDVEVGVNMPDELPELILAVEDVLNTFRGSVMKVRTA